MFYEELKQIIGSVLQQGLSGQLVLDDLIESGQLKHQLRRRLKRNQKKN